MPVAGPAIRARGCVRRGRDRAANALAFGLPSLLLFLAPASGLAASLGCDQPDYSPGDRVVFAGSGWRPGETVTVELSVVPRTHADIRFTVAASERGDWREDGYVVAPSDLGVLFVARAHGDKGSLSEVLTFTDNGFALQVYGYPGQNESCLNGRATWTSGSNSGTVGEGAPYVYHNVSGRVDIHAHPRESNLSISWSSQDASWNVISGCGAGDLDCSVRDGNYVDLNIGEPYPVIETLAPDSAVAGSGDLTMVVMSPLDTFTNNSVVRFDGYLLATTFVAMDQLTAVVPAARLATQGSYVVTVRNPAAPAFGERCGINYAHGACPGTNGGDSNEVFFTVHPPAAEDAGASPPDAEVLDQDASAGEDASAGGEDAASADLDAGALPGLDAAAGPDGGVEPLDGALVPADAAAIAEDASAAEPDGGEGDEGMRVYDLGGCGCGSAGAAGSGALALLTCLVAAGRGRRRRQ